MCSGSRHAIDVKDDVQVQQINVQIPKTRRSGVIMDKPPGTVLHILLIVKYYFIFK